MKRFALSLLVIGSFFLAFIPQSAHASTPDYALMSATSYNELDTAIVTLFRIALRTALENFL